MAPHARVAELVDAHRLKIVFRKEWGFDSLHGHQPSLLRSYGWQASWAKLAEQRRLPVVAQRAKTGWANAIRLF